MGAAWVMWSSGKANHCASPTTSTEASLLPTLRPDNSEAQAELGTEPIKTVFSVPKFCILLGLLQVGFNGQEAKPCNIHTIYIDFYSATGRVSVALLARARAFPAIHVQCAIGRAGHRGPGLRGHGSARLPARLCLRAGRRRGAPPGSCTPGLNKIIK